MEPTQTEHNTVMKPKTILELLPELSGILSEESIRTLTAKKQHRNKTAVMSTNEKQIKPMTIAEMMSQLQVIRAPTPKMYTQSSTTKARKPWNSSVKTDTKRADSKTAKQNLKNSNVRKVLNFQSKPKTIDRTPLIDNYATPKFKKPELKTVHRQRANNVRISGINIIAPTPINDLKKCENSQNRVKIEDKENTASTTWNKKFLKPQNKKITQLKLCTTTLDTPISNSSIISTDDTTFLQKEKEINDLEEGIPTMIYDERTLENIDEVSPPASTPFTEYRSVQECLNDSNNFENSAAFNDTIMCFDKTFYPTENNEKEESMIVSLCDLLDKASVKNSDASADHELNKLLALEKQIEASLQMLMKLKENHEKALSKVKELIQAKRNNSMENLNVSMVTSLTQKIETKKGEVTISQNLQARSVVISKSPVKKFAEKRQSLRKTVLHKSMPSGLNEYSDTKIKLNEKSPATCMYRQLKKSMKFLHTPRKERSSQVAPDTPAITSQNIQKQLFKLYEN